MPTGPRVLTRAVCVSPATSLLEWAGRHFSSTTSGIGEHPLNHRRKRVFRRLKPAAGFVPHVGGFTILASRLLIATGGLRARPVFHPGSGPRSAHNHQSRPNAGGC